MICNSVWTNVRALAKILLSDRVSAARYSGIAPEGVVKLGGLLSTRVQMIFNVWLVLVQLPQATL